MKRWLFVGAVVCLGAACTEGGEPVGSVGGESTGAAFTSVMKGGGAHLFGGDRFSLYFVDVFEGGSPSDPSASLMYHFHSVDPTSEVCEEHPPPPDMPPPPCDPTDPACDCAIDPTLCEPPPPCDPATDPRCEPVLICRYTRFVVEMGWGPIPPQDFSVRPSGALLDTVVSAETGFYAERCVEDRTTWTRDCTPVAGGEITLRWTENGRYSDFHSGVSQRQFGPHRFHTNGVWRSSSADAFGTLLGNALSDEGFLDSGLNVQKSLFIEPPR